MAPSKCFDSASCIFTSPCPPLSLPDPDVSLLPFLSSTTRASHFEDLLAIVDASTSDALTFSQLRSRTQSAARALSFLGISQHDVVLIVSPNSVHFPVIFYAIIWLGAIATPTNPLNTPNEILHQAAVSNAKLIVTVPELAYKLCHSALPILLINDTHSSSPSYTYTQSAQFLSEVIKQSAQHTVPSVHIQQTDAAALLYTSGTTGASKGAVISHKNFIAAALQVKLDANMCIDKEHGCTVLCCVPMFHAFGLSVILNAQLHIGHTVIIMPKYSTLDMLAAIETYRITHLPVVPTIMVALKKNDDFRNYDLSSVVEVLCGAGCTNKETMEEVCRRLPNAIVRLDYGMTEASGRIAISTCEPTTSKSLGFIGPLVSGMEAVVVDEGSGKRLFPNEQGELWVQGPNIIQGYLENEEVTDLTIDEDGWMHTGDLVLFDREGNLHIVGRLKDLIKYKGFQVAPVELETLLMTHSAIVDAAVVPFPDEFAGEVPLAFVVLAQGSTLEELDVIRFVDSQVAPYKKVRKVKFVAKLPKTASGKILRRELVEQGKAT